MELQLLCPRVVALTQWTISLPNFYYVSNILNKLLSIAINKMGSKNESNHNACGFKEILGSIQFDFAMLNLAISSTPAETPRV